MSLENRYIEDIPEKKKIRQQVGNKVVETIKVFQALLHKKAESTALQKRLSPTVATSTDERLIRTRNLV